MGIQHVTQKIITCDICGNQCSESDGDIQIKVNSGDGRDVGPAYITGSLRFDQPYGCSNGIICRSCKIKYLKKYMEQQCKQ